MDAVAHAVAEPNRRAILRVVRDGERSVGEIAAEFEITRPAVSQHLRVLHDAHLVTVRAVGNRRFYRARPEGLAELRRWMEEFWRASLATLKIEIERDLGTNPTDQSLSTATPQPTTRPQSTISESTISERSEP
ncbi:MAG: metalloregulator ArsR/SmtB family transcription factor [Actinomycetota bacterium]